MSDKHNGSFVLLPLRSNTIQLDVNINHNFIFLNNFDWSNTSSGVYFGNSKLFHQNYTAVNRKVFIQPHRYHPKHICEHIRSTRTAIVICGNYLYFHKFSFLSRNKYMMKWNCLYFFFTLCRYNQGDMTPQPLFMLFWNWASSPTHFPQMSTW